LDGLVNNRETNTEGLLILTELVFKTTGKRSYILIDEYDKLLSDNYDSKAYDDIRAFETQFLSAGLKGNNYLEKAMLTGVMRVSRESILSGLNNLQTYDIFSDDVYTDDFGFTEEEIGELLKITDFDKDALKAWYNGVKINGKEIYNTYSVLTFLQKKRFGNYWGRSGTANIIISLLNDDRKETVIRLLNGEEVKTYVKDRISLQELNDDPGDSDFYSQNKSLPMQTAIVM
jgi:hypothetical protein